MFDNPQVPNVAATFADFEAARQMMLRAALLVAEYAPDLIDAEAEGTATALRGIAALMKRV